MALLPEVEKLVAQLKSADVSFTDLDVGGARELYVQTLAASSGAPVAMASVVDDTLPGPAGAIPIRRYRPEGLASMPAPTIVYYHGGGWVLGDLESHDRICRQIASRSGCQLIAVEYRLAPEHPLSGTVEDAMTALQWLLANPDQHGIDAQRVAVAGDSAGGHLSAVVALAARDKGLPLAFQALIYPATDLRDEAQHYPSAARNAHVPPLTGEFMQWFGAHQNIDERTNLAEWRFSPLLADSVAGVAPALMVTCGGDVLMDQGTLYAARLHDAGVPCEHAHFAGVPHGSIEMYAWLEVTSTMLERVAEALRNALSAQ